MNHNIYIIIIFMIECYQSRTKSGNFKTQIVKETEFGVGSSCTKLYQIAEEPQLAMHKVFWEQVNTCTHYWLNRCVWSNLR